jgi:hypothetical protein
MSKKLMTTHVFLTLGDVQNFFLNKFNFQKKNCILCGKSYLLLGFEPSTYTNLSTILRKLMKTLFITVKLSQIFNLFSEKSINYQLIYLTIRIHNLSLQQSFLFFFHSPLKILLIWTRFLVHTTPFTNQ